LKWQVKFLEGELKNVNLQLQMQNSRLDYIESYLKSWDPAPATAEEAK